MVYLNNVQFITREWKSTNLEHSECLLIHFHFASYQFLLWNTEAPLCITPGPGIIVQNGGGCSQESSNLYQVPQIARSYIPGTVQSATTTAHSRILQELAIASLLTWFVPSLPGIKQLTYGHRERETGICFYSIDYLSLGFSWITVRDSMRIGMKNGK